MKLSKLKRSDLLILIHRLLKNEATLIREIDDLTAEIERLKHPKPARTTAANPFPTWLRMEWPR